MPSLGNPSALLWSLLIAPLVILYLRNQRLRRLSVPAVLFWETSDEPESSAPGKTQLHNRVSLILLSLAILSGAFALAHPDWIDPSEPSKNDLTQTEQAFSGLESSAEDPNSAILVIDNSASMKVRDCNGQTRFEAAIDLAESLVRSAPDRVPMSIVTTARGLQVHCQNTRSRDDLLNCLAGLQPTDASGGPNGAWSSLLSAAQIHPNTTRIIVLSDESAPDTNEDINSEQRQYLQHEWHRLGQSQDNTGIVNIKWNRSQSPAGPSAVDESQTLSHTLNIDILNSGHDQQQTEVQIYVEHEPFDVIPLDLAPGELRTQAIELPADIHGLLTVALAHDDVFPVDNSISIVLPMRTPAKAAFVTQGNLFLQRALESIDLISVQTVPPERLPEVIRQTPQFLILDRPTTQTLDLLKTAAIPTLIIQPEQPGSRVISGPIWVYDSPNFSILKDLNSPELKLSEAITFDFSAPCDPILQSSDGLPLLTRTIRSGQPQLVMGFDPTADELPIRAIFPAFIYALLQDHILPESDLPICLSTSARIPISNFHASFVNNAMIGETRPIVCVFHTTTYDGQEYFYDYPVYRLGQQWYTDSPPIAGHHYMTLETPDGSSSTDTFTAATTGLLNAEEGNLRRAELGSTTSTASQTDIHVPFNETASATRSIPLTQLLIGLALMCLATDMFLKQSSWLRFRSR